ncbi:MAG: SRPBCC domain-containing protein [Bacteroidia bacterium]
MAAIKHLFHINAPKDKVYEALTTITGLSNWWTKQTTGNTDTGGVIHFRFGEFGNDMKVTAMKPNESVSWECVDGSPDWVGTKINFLLDTNDGKTRVRFEHADWKEANDFFAGCSFSWARYMESLRQFCQTGRSEAFGSDGYRI